MQDENFISTELLCLHHSIDPSFVHALYEYGLIEITTMESSDYVHVSQLGDLEKMIRLHYELQINIEGIEAITHLVRRIEKMQEELMFLKNQLKRYEPQLMHDAKENSA
ncbi:MAG TPA: chaperone modulator CbpM [Flavisolibacter sp.]|nr:chaperone modulator CbpM [Flavisolibacter sp.]